ncbi:hypothetical protein QAD02_016342, partial [Eretmocerus hayati]
MRSDILMRYHQYGLRVFKVCPDSYQWPGFYLLVGFIIFYLICGVWALASTFVDVDTLMREMVPVIGSAIISAKFVAFYMNRRKVADMIEEMCDDCTSESISIPSKEVIWKNIKIARIISYITLSMGASMVLLMVSAPVMPYLTDDIDHRRFVIKSTLSKQPPFYELTIICQAFTVTTAVYGNCVLEGQMIFLVLHACSKIHMVRERIIETKKHFSDPYFMDSAIKEIVQKHINFLSFTKDIGDAYSLTNLIHTIFVTFCIVTGGFMLIISAEEKDLLGVIHYAVFIMDFLFKSGLYCFVGEYLTTQGETIALEIAKCDWYELPIRHKKQINFILMRADIPITMSCGKFASLSNELLSS